MERLEEIFNRLYSKYPLMGDTLYIDLETTGFERDARIIEIGAIGVIFDGFEVKFKTYESLINPGFPISTKITEITGITNEELQTARGDEVYDEFIGWVRSFEPKRSVAHNAKFDKSKADYNFIRVGRTIEILPPFECTLQLARKNIHDTKADNLKALSEYFKFKNTNAHRALSDTEVCAYIHAKILLGEYNESRV